MKKKINFKWPLGIFFMLALFGFGVSNASDHDDGISDVKEKNLNLTDLYAFREDNQTGKSEDKKNLILIMNSNPRAIGGQQEYFSMKGRYEFHITRVSKENKNATPTGADDFILRFEFSEPDANQRQNITVTAIQDGVTLPVTNMDSDGLLQTTSMTDVKNKNYKENVFKINDSELKVFAGLREDPFFFDVEQFFKVRAGAAGLGPKVGFKAPEEAVDFTVGYNVNTITLRVPIELLQSGEEEPVFDVWEIVTLK